MLTYSLMCFYRRAMKERSSESVNTTQLIVMNNYFTPLLRASSINFLTPPLVIQSTYKSPQQMAVERLFIADRLSPDWFTPSTLKINNLSQLEKKLGELKAKIKHKYGEYQRVEAIANDRYRIIFENADLNMVIARFELDFADRIDEIEVHVDPRLID
jgi:hypothetical protein